MIANLLQEWAKKKSSITSIYPPQSILLCYLWPLVRPGYHKLYQIPRFWAQPMGSGEGQKPQWYSHDQWKHGNTIDLRKFTNHLLLRWFGWNFHTKFFELLVVASKLILCWSNSWYVFQKMKGWGFGRHQQQHSLPPFAYPYPQPSPGVSDSSSAKRRRSPADSASS